MPTSPRLSPDVLVPRRSAPAPAPARGSRSTRTTPKDSGTSPHLLAAAMVDAHPDVNVLLLSGPARRGRCRPRTARTSSPSRGSPRTSPAATRAWSLDSSLEQVLAVRSFALESVLVNFAPTCWSSTRSRGGSWGSSSEACGACAGRTAPGRVLGLRDVLDDVTTTRREWRDSRSREAIRSLYDQVWVYGDEAVFDPAEVYGWTPEVREEGPLHRLPGRRPGPAASVRSGVARGPLGLR